MVARGGRREGKRGTGRHGGRCGGVGRWMRSGERVGGRRSVRWWGGGCRWRLGGGRGG